MADWRQFPLMLFLEHIRGDFQLSIADHERLLRVLQAGDDWTLARLENVLCALFARDPDQAVRFRRHFSNFFVSCPEQVDPATVAQWIKALHAEAATELPVAAAASVPVRESPRLSTRGRSGTDTDEHSSPRRRLYLLITLLFVVAFFAVWQQLQPIDPPPTQHQLTNQSPEAQATVNDPQPDPPAPESKMREYRVPKIVSITQSPLPRPDSMWPWWAAAAGLMLLLSIAFALHLRRLQRPPKDRAPEIDPDAPQFFAPGTIGGSLPARIPSDELSAMADAMGYFSSEQAGKKLDVTASIHATLKQGGIAVCCFFSRKRVRTLLILLDEQADAAGWSPIATELAQGMTRHAVPVIFGRYRGNPNRFVDQDGQQQHIADLEDQRHGLLVLMFSDGLSFHRQQVQRTLEQLSHWPMVAWMDLRLPQYQREGVKLAAKLHLPHYNADAAGILHALGRFLAETGADRSQPAPAESIPGMADIELDCWLEMQLGTALLWLADCSKIEPITPALAQRLREQFHPHLKPEQIELLHRLPGTTRSRAGLRFSHDVRCALGFIWLKRRSEAEQKAVLQFLLQQVEVAKPEVSAKSLEMLGWELIRQKLLLELGEGGDLKRLGELMQSELKQTLADQLQAFALPDEKGQWAEGKIPLRIRPEQPEALLRLKQLDDNPLNIGMLVKSWHMVVIGALSAVSLWFIVGATYLIFEQPFMASQLLIVGGNNHMLMRLDDAEEDAPWLSLGDQKKMEMIPDLNYKLSLFALGGSESRRLVTNNGEQVQVILNSESLQQPCISQLNIGVEVLRCSVSEMTGKQSPVSRPTWRQSNKPDGEALVSIGIEISANPSSGMQAFREVQWQGNNVDLIIRIARDDPSLEEKINQALKQENGLADVPVQLLAWSDVRSTEIRTLVGTVTPIYLPDFTEGAAIGKQLAMRDRLAFDVAKLEARQMVLINQSAAAVVTPPVVAPSEPMIAFTVNTTPKDATVRIMNIKDRYEPGMSLAAGQYDLMVSADGYADYRQWVSLYAGGGAASVTLKELPKVGQLTLEMVPASTIATVSNGKASFQLKSGEALPLAAGDWSISAEAKEFKPWQGTVQMAAQNLKRVIRLEAIAKGGCVAGVERTVDGMALVCIPPGEFMMGSSDGASDEKPVHKVTIRQAFWMGKFEVTQAQWESVMGSNPSHFKGEQNPVEQVSWDDTQNFLKRLQQKTNKAYRLPSEAEWEYAARAGTTTPYSFDGGEGKLGEYGWYSANANTTHHPVGEKRANPWGLHDMHGNVWEWNQDCWNGNYDKAPSDGSARLSGDCDRRVLRGGSWGGDPRNLRSANRFGHYTDFRSNVIGFRVVLSASAVQD